MQSWIKTVWTVARWEFHRYFKLKDQLIGLVSLLIGGIVGFGAIRLAQSAGQVRLAIMGASPDWIMPEKGRFNQLSEVRTESEWRERLESRDLDGLVIITDGDGSNWQSKLIVRNEPTWLAELEPLLQRERMQAQMKRSKLDPMELAQIVAPSQVVVEMLHDRNVSKSDRLVAYLLLIATVMTSWIGLAYMLTGITGEKQQRVTEQIVSAIQPQAWIDGKWIGITAASIGSLAFLFVTSAISLPIAGLMGYPVSLPDSLQRWELFPVLLLYYVGGVLFWNCFYAAVASIINDPNTSARTSMLFLPMLPMIASGLVVSQPDGLMMRGLSWIPGASSTAMPMRMVLGEVAAVEIGFSLILLVAGIAGMRRLTGRIFAAGIMLYGKEPTWFDIARWVVRGPTH